MSYQTLNKQIQYPLSGSFTGSFNGTATTASYVAWGNIGGNINNQNDLSGSLSNGNTAFSWGNHANAGYALTSSLAGYVPYTGATDNLDLGANSLIFSAATGAGRIKLPDAGTTSTDGIAFGDFFIFRSALQTISLQSSSATWTINAAILGAPTNQSSTFRIGGSRTLTFDNGVGGTIMSLNSSSGTTTIRGNSPSTGTVLLLQNSTPTDLFTVDNTGKIGLRPTNFELWFGTIGNASYANLKQVSGVLTLQATNNSSTINLSGGIIGDYLTGANVYGVNITNTVNTRTITGTYSLLRLFQNITPTSGISNTNFLEISGTIQQTGGANGITRGILIAPTLTAASNYIGIESNGRIQIGLPTLNSWGSYAYSGKYINAGIYLEGVNSPIDLRLQATGLSGGNGVVHLFAGNNNNSYLLLGFTYLRESSGGLFVGTTNTAPGATLHVRGNSPTTGSIAIFQNSAPTDILNVYNNGRVAIGSGFTPSVALECNTTIRAWNQLEVGQFASVVINNSSFTKTVSGSDYFTFNNQTSFNASSGSYYFLRLSSGVAVSGSASVNILPIVGTINQAAGATGIIRGIFLNHTFTNAIDYRAIEVITGNNAAHTMLKLNNGAQDVFCVRGDGKAGFFGKMTGQAVMPAVSAGASYTATEQKMLNDVYTAVRDFGIGN